MHNKPNISEIIPIVVVFAMLVVWGIKKLIKSKNNKK
jgi:hypothetical protein